MHEVGHVVAVVPRSDTSESILDDLRFVGIDAEIVRAQPGMYRLEDQSFHEHVGGVERGLVLGLGIGALVALAVILTVGAVRNLSWFTQLLLIGGIALQGTIPAVMWRMGRIERYDDDPEAVSNLTAEDRLVVVHSPHDETRARQVLGRHAVTFLADESPT